LIARTQTASFAVLTGCENPNGACSCERIACGFGSATIDNILVFAEKGTQGVAALSSSGPVLAERVATAALSMTLETKIFVPLAGNLARGLCGAAIEEVFGFAADNQVLPPP
jgi:hypothetical protein